MTKESRWKLPKSKKKKHQEPSVSVEGGPVALQSVEDGVRKHRHRNGSSKKDAAQEEPIQTESRHKRRGSSKVDKGDEASAMRSRVQLLQASLAGRIGNPMGPRPAQIKIPTSESEDPSESQSFLFGAGSMPVQDEYKAETAHMSAAERLRYLRRKRQEATLTKEKSVLDDGFMQEFARNMKQKESTGGMRSQAATKRWKEQEEAEQERKRLQLLEEQERKRQEEAEQEARELAKEIAEEEERRGEIEAEEKRKRDEKHAEEEKRLREKEIEEKRADEELQRKEKEAEEGKKHDEADEEQHQEEKQAEDVTMKDEKRGHEEREAPLKLDEEVNASPEEAAEDDEVKKRKIEKEKRRERRRKEKEAAMRMVDEAAADSEQAGENENKESEIPIKRRSRKHEQHQADIEPDEINHELDQLSIIQETGNAIDESEKSKEKPRKNKKKMQRFQDPIDNEDPLDESRKITSSPGSYLGHSHENHSHGHDHHAHGGHRCFACEQNAASMGLTTMPYPPPMPYGGMCACGYPASGVPYAVALPPPSMAYYGYPPPPPMQMLPPPYAVTPSPPPSYVGQTSTAMTMYSQGPSSGYGSYGAPVMLSKCQGCGGVGVDVAEKNGFCSHCNRLRLDFIVASAQIRRRCSACGGWGLQLVQASGKCQHCERQEMLRGVAGSQQRASSSPTLKIETAPKNRGAEQDNDEDWDESSDEGSDWDE